ncbi:MAG: surface-adhesin E family protein [Spongiibacteraceae bacterium]
MRNVLGMVAMLAVCSPALAEWSKISTGHNTTSYADLNTLRKNGDIATMWVLVDFVKVPFDGNNLPYLSLKMNVEYHCTTTQFRFLKLTSFVGHMATGKQPYTSVDPGTWQAVVPGTVQKPLWDVACRQ